MRRSHAWMQHLRTLGVRKLSDERAMIAQSNRCARVSECRCGVVAHQEFVVSLWWSRESTMRRFLVTMFTFGSCAIPVHAFAKPRATSGSASHAKSSPTAASPPSESTDALYARLVAAADADEDTEVTHLELESLVHEYVER